MPKTHYQFLDSEITQAFQKTCFDNALAQEVFSKVLPCLRKNSIEDYNRAVLVLAAKYGDQYDTLVPNAKVLFATVRSVEAFFSGNLVMASAFCLEARQTNLNNGHSLNLNNFAATLKKIRSELDQGVELTSEQVLERSIFDLHLAKLFDVTPDVTKEANNSLMRLLDDNALSTLSARNPVLHGHTVYLLGQRAMFGVSRSYVDKLLVMLEGNKGFFLTPAQVAMNAYRESAQMLYSAEVAMHSNRSDKFEFLKNLATFAALHPAPIVGVLYRQTVISALWEKDRQVLESYQWGSICRHFKFEGSERMRYDILYRDYRTQDEEDPF